MATFSKRSGSWQAKVCKRGIRKSATFPTKQQAQEWASRIETEAIAGHHGLAVRKTLREAIEAFLEGRPEEERHANAFMVSEPHLCDRQLSALNPSDFVAFRDRRSKLVSAGTVRREFSTLGGVFRLAVERRWIMVNPCREVRKPQSPPSRKRGVSQVEIDTMVKALGPDGIQREIALCFLLGIETGMRQGEMLSLTRDQVDLKRRTVTLIKTKNGDAREVPLSHAAVAILTACGKDKEGGGKVGPAFHVAPGTLDTLFRRARDAAVLVCPSLATLHFHDSRSEAITRLSKRLDVLELARVIGHRDLRSLMAYYAPSVSDLAKKLDGPRNTP